MTTTDIEAALRKVLPPGQQAAAGELARLLDAAAQGQLSPEQVEARFRAEPVLVAAVSGLAGQRVEVDGKFISFKGAQIGEVVIEDAGRDIVKLNIGTYVAQQNIYYTPTPSARSPHEQRNRRAMLTKVKNIWIDGLLNRSLTDELRIELNLVDRPDAVDIPLNAVVQELERPPRALAPGVPISEVFDQVGGKLLILGAPGAGKTTLLLELARDLIVRAEQDDGHPIPVIFNLSSWTAKRLCTFTNWRNAANTILFLLHQLQLQ